MSYIRFNDVSQYQGNYNMADGNPAVAIKMSGGDAGLYFDSKAALNYQHASASDKVIIGYHFAGGTVDVNAEADFFVRAMSPLAENDVLALDWEVQHPNPVEWCRLFVQRVYDQTGVWPLVYMNMSTANAHDWSPVFDKCGFWCAAPSYSFDATLPVKYPQVAQQGPIVNGVDTDAFFGTVDDLKKYGYHSTSAISSPPPTSPPVAPAAPSADSAVPVPPETPATSTTSTTITSASPTGPFNITVSPPPASSLHVSLLQRILNFLKNLLGLK